MLTVSAFFLAVSAVFGSVLVACKGDMVETRTDNSLAI